MKPYRVLFYALMCLGNAQISFAQQSSSAAGDGDITGETNDEIVIIEPSEHDNIVVYGGVLNRPNSDRTTSITVLKQPDQSTGIRVENLIRNIPGWQQFRRSDARSANPTSQGITARGLGGNASSRALVLLDGVPQSDPFGGWVNWTAFDAVRLSGVRILHGGGNGANGPGALAGTIELSSEQYPSHYLGAAFGSRKDVDIDAQSGANLGDGRVIVNGSFSRGDGFIPVTANQRGSVDGRAGYRSYGGGLRTVIPVDDAINLEMAVRGFDDRRSRGIPFSDNDNSGVDASVRVVKRCCGWDWLALGYVQVRQFSSEFASVSADRNSVTQTLDQYDVPSTGLGARFELRPVPQVRLGLDWRRTSGVTKEDFTFVSGRPTRNRQAGGNSNVVGVYGEVSGEFGILNVSASARIDRWWLSGGFRKEVNIGGSTRSDERFADRSGWNGTGRIGAAIQPVGALKVQLSGYTGWRLPTLNELYRPFRVGSDATAANEGLQPERLVGGDVTFEGNVDFLDEAKLTLFYNRLQNPIANVTLGQGAGVFPGVGFVAAGGIFRQRQNLKALNSKGVEIALKKQFGDFRLEGAYSYVDARISGGVLSGLHPAQIPAHNARLDINYEARGTAAAGIGISYASGQFEDDLNRIKLKDAFTVDGRVNFAVTPKLRLSIRAENLLNSTVQAAISSSGIIERAVPRTFWIGLQFSGGN